MDTTCPQCKRDRWRTVNKAEGIYMCRTPYCGIVTKNLRKEDDTEEPKAS